MEHDHYMDIKFLISIWDGDLGRGMELSGGERWALRNFFKKMNSRQRSDTIDGQHRISEVLIEERMIDNKGKILFSDEWNKYDGSSKPSLFKRFFGL